jgi:hypothetical protein
MTSDREFAETLLLGRWDGYSEEQLTIELLLKRSMGIVDGEGSEVGYREAKVGVYLWVVVCQNAVPS